MNAPSVLAMDCEPEGRALRVRRMHGGFEFAVLGGDHARVIVTVWVSDVGSEEIGKLLQEHGGRP